MDKNKKLATLTLGTGLAYYFLIYLPEQERKEEKARQKLIFEENQRKEQAQARWDFARGTRKHQGNLLKP